MKTLFLSHNPHEVHLNFAKAINAKIKIIPFKAYVNLMKKYRFLSYLYPVISLICSLFIKVKQDFLLVDGGSSLYTAYFLKIRNKKLKIIYLDGDLFFYNLQKSKKISKKIIKSIIKNIDFVISVSKQNKNYISKYVKAPIKVCPPYPNLPYSKETKQNKKQPTTNKDYGLYIGRLDPDKNIKRIVKFALQCPYFEKFIIIGDGTLKNYIKKLSKSNNKIIYLGTKKETAKYYNLCKFLIHLPDADPHPCTTMEAAIQGCYPIISKKTGTAYFFDKTFIVDNPEDFREINKKIEFISKNNKKAKKLLNKAKNHFPTKKQSLNNFKEKFKEITNQK